MDRAHRVVQEKRLARVRLVIGAAIGLALLFGMVTLLALEGREVVVVRTRDADGHPHATRTWVADADGYAWIEAANPERPFLHDLGREPRMELVRDGTTRRCDAAIEPNPSGHQRVRDLLTAKYGWADRWIALIADTRRSVAVRLDCR